MYEKNVIKFVDGISLLLLLFIGRFIIIIIIFIIIILLFFWNYYYFYTANQFKLNGPKAQSLNRIMGLARTGRSHRHNPREERESSQNCTPVQS